MFYIEPHSFATIPPRHSGFNLIQWLQTKIPCTQARIHSPHCTFSPLKLHQAKSSRQLTPTMFEWRNKHQKSSSKERCRDPHPRSVQAHTFQKHYVFPMSQVGLTITLTSWNIVKTENEAMHLGNCWSVTVAKKKKKKKLLLTQECLHTNLNSRSSRWVWHMTSAPVRLSSNCAGHPPWNYA